MSEENGAKKGFRRKLSKRPKTQRIPSTHIPDRFNDGDDAHEDVTAPSGKVAQYMNQSVFGMIAQAGSRTDFGAPLHDGDDSESCDDAQGPLAVPKRQKDGDQGSNESQTSDGTAGQARQGSKHRRKFSDHKLLRSLPKLSIKKARESSRGRSSEMLSPAASPRLSAARDAPVMSRMLEAKAQFDASNSDPDIVRQSMDKYRIMEEDDLETSLAGRLMEIFGFEELETVVSEYPCWLLQSVLLQGYMYVTQKHICFYAYLPKKSNVVAKSGYLSKRGRQSPKHTRYWFQLKGDVLSYYMNPSDLYFPSGHIDLRYGISANLAPGKETKEFQVTTNQRSYHFRADSHASAKEWIKTLQKVIFRSHNDGDSVKISLPIQNVIDIDESPVLDIANTFKIRVVESDDSFAIDEVSQSSLESDFFRGLIDCSITSPFSVLEEKHSTFYGF